MKPILYLSGYMAGAATATPKPLGAGAATPKRVHKRGRRVATALPQLPCALERHGLDPKVVATACLSG